MQLFPKYPPIILKRPFHWVTTTLIENDIDPSDVNGCMVQLAWMLEKYNEHWKVNGKTFYTYPTKQQIEDSYNCPTCGENHEGNVPRECETGDGV